MIAPIIRKIQSGKLSWIDVEEPDLKTLQELQEEHGFHELDVEDCLSDNQRSKVDEYEDYLFVILHLPYLDKRKDTVKSGEVDVFIKNNVLITVHWGALKPVTDLFEECERKEASRKKYMGLSTGYLLYELLDQLFTSVFPVLASIENDVGRLEKDAFSDSMERDMLRDILFVKKNIITSRRVILPLRTVVGQIEHKNKKFLPDTLDVYFDDIMDKVEKIWSSLENLQELIESLQDTNESIIAHTSNRVVKTLTVFSVVMLPLNLLASMYGMNINLPFAEHEHMFFFLGLGMFLVLGALLVIFKIKRWI
ncbi:magnesium transporter CorA family protein [Candidatus Peregrinibacteria bacterium]|nr:MAG: magnesium transporter CorA family protein [Candidatus Peregrinibacteria bacterium]